MDRQQRHVAADPEVVLDMLTDPDACRRWSPVPFDLDGAYAGRLAAGSRMRVSGSLAGTRRRLRRRRARGRRRAASRCPRTAPSPSTSPTRHAPPGGGSDVRASVSVRSGGGLFGRVAESATAALLQAGALGVAVDRIAASATA